MKKIVIIESTCFDCKHFTVQNTLSGPWGYCDHEEYRCDIPLDFAKRKGWCLGYEPKDKLP